MEMIQKFTNTDYNIENSAYYDLYYYYKDGGNIVKMLHAMSTLARGIMELQQRLVG